MKRIVVAGIASGVGKTTVVVALAAALKARGLSVQTFKCGPDYLDPSWHTRASGRPSYNLDGWMMGRDAVLASFARAEADIAIIEGMMGLYDGASPINDEGSAAEIARWLNAPVVAVVDAWAIARTIAAIGLGLRELDRRVNVAGLFANRVGSRAHLQLLVDACRDTVPVVAGLPKDDSIALPERHLGLHHAAQVEIDVQRWAALLEEWNAVEPLLEIASSAPYLELPTNKLKRPATKCRIGIARDEAFHFYYEDNLARLQSLGAELVEFSPIRDALPEVDGLYFGGGYPELHAKELAGNRAIIESIRKFAGPIYAECGGLMYLCNEIDHHEMVGLVDASAVTTPRLQALGYVEVSTVKETIFGPAGLRYRGHQFRHCKLEQSPGEGALQVGSELQGWGGPRVLASWVHAHWASCPEAAENFVRSCA